MSRMFHRVLAASAVGAVALAVPATALAADTGGGGGAMPTSVAVHLPAHVKAGQPITVTARITPQEAAGRPGAGGHHGKGHGTKGVKGTSKGVGHRKGGGGHGTTRGTGHGRHHAVTGEVRFFLDGKAEPAVEVSRDQASEKLRIPLGRHVLVAEYLGDADYLASRSAPVAFMLEPGQPVNPGGEEGPGQGEGPGEGPVGLGPDAPDAPAPVPGRQGDGQDGPGLDGQGGDQGDLGGWPGAGQGGWQDGPSGQGGQGDWPDAPAPGPGYEQPGGIGQA